jgi:hypothetical protein
LNELDSFVSEYNGAVVVRRISPPAGMKVREDCDERLKEFMENQDPKDYETSLGELVDTTCVGPLGIMWKMWSGMCWKRTGDDSLFCSELLAKTYQFMGYISDRRAANMYTPSDFSSSGITNLRNGFTLQREQIVSFA